MTTIARQLAEDYPEEWQAMDGHRTITIDAMPGYILPVRSAADIRRFVWILFGVVGLTLLLASANVANLLLARATARQREIGIRIAIGAQRGRLVRQLLTESVTLAVFGGTAGLLVASWMLDVMAAFQLPGGLAIGALGIELDQRILVFALLLSLVTAVAFGLVPALQATRPGVVNSLKGESTERGGSQQRLRKALVAVQVALCLILLVGSGLFLRTLRNSLRSDIGFDAENVVVARFNLAFLRYTPEQGTAFVDQLLERVRALPGVTAASVSTLVPFQAGGFRGMFAEIDGYSTSPGEEIRVDYVFVQPGYYRSLGIPLLQGRDFGPSDIEGSRRAVVINRHMAERYFSDRDPVGGIVRFAGGPAMEVVGVVGDPVWSSLGEEPTPFVFVPMAQSPDVASRSFITLVARTGRNAEEFTPLLAAQFRELEPGLSLTFIRTMEQQIGSALMPQRMGTVLFTLFGVLALALAAVGIYGVVGYSVTRQAREIGVRIALGASKQDILRGVVFGIAAPVAAGLAVGGATALALSRTLESFMFGVSPSDPLTFVVIAALLALVATLAALIPARRAARLDPMRVLTTE
jgi:predicted permease